MKIASRRSEWLYAALAAAWLFGLVFPATGDPETRDALQIAALAWPLPLGLLLSRSWFVIGPAFRGSRAMRLSALLFMAAIAISSTLSLEPAFSFMYFAVTILGFTCCAGLWSCVAHMEHALAAYAYSGTAFMAYVYAKGDAIQGRLTFGHPNYLGLISFGILVCCFSVRPLVIRAILVLVNIVIINEAEARACLLASAIAILVHALLVMKSRWPQRRLLLATIAALIGLPLIGITYSDEIRASASSLLLVDDKYRGIGTGFTGRVEAWQEAYGLFLQSPIFGVGYRRHEPLMTSLPSAHNGYLAMLAETGLTGLIFVLALVSVCAWRLFGIARTGDRIAIIGFSFVCGYLFIAMFDRYLVNFGSPTSVLMWLFLFMPRWPRPGITQPAVRERLPRPLLDLSQHETSPST